MNKELVMIARELLSISMMSMSALASDKIVCQAIEVLEQAKCVREPKVSEVNKD